MAKANLPVLSIGGAICLMLCGAASASQLVYQPVSPSFGGNPFNGTYVLQQAQAQGAGASGGQQSPNLSGLANSLSNIGGSSTPGSVIVINPTSTTGTTGSTTIP